MSVYSRPISSVGLLDWRRRSPPPTAPAEPTFRCATTSASPRRRRCRFRNSSLAVASASSTAGHYDRPLLLAGRSPRGYSSRGPTHVLTRARSVHNPTKIGLLRISRRDPRTRGGKDDRITVRATGRGCRTGILADPPLPEPELMALPEHVSPVGRRFRQYQRALLQTSELVRERSPRASGGPVSSEVGGSSSIRFGVDTFRSHRRIIDPQHTVLHDWMFAARERLGNACRTGSILPLAQPLIDDT